MTWAEKDADHPPKETGRQGQSRPGLKPLGHLNKKLIHCALFLQQRVQFFLDRFLIKETDMPPDFLP